MNHWAYHTDDDEHPCKESCSADATKQQHAVLQRTGADCSKSGETAPNAVTNAPGDPSWWQLVPSPENAQPLPRIYQHKQPVGCAPDFEKGELLPPDDDGSYQDPRLPPGVVDISEELRWP